MRKRVILPVVLTLFAVFAGSAQAGKQTPAVVTMHLPPGGSAAYFYGSVSSVKGACERSRTIKVVQDPTGNSGYQPYASGIKSNRDGTWTFEPAGPYVVNGYYKAIAAKKKISGGVCQKARSKAFFVD